MDCRFTVHGAPIPKGRPRFNGKTVYTPARTRNFETLVAYTAKAAILGEPTESPCRVTIHIYGSFRGDMDNVAKAFLDAMNGIVYKDDKQVTELHVIRFDGEQRTNVTVEWDA